MDNTPRKRYHGATGPYYPRNQVDPEAVRQGIEDGQSCRQIARDLGTSYMTIYRVADKAGLQPRRGLVLPPMTLRQAVQDMSVTEALEYALSAYEAISGQDCETRRLAPDSLTSQQTLIFGVLYRRLGIFVTSEALISAMDTAAADVTSSTNVLAVQVSKMRPKLAGKYTIASAWGVGYKMEKVDG